MDLNQKIIDELIEIVKEHEKRITILERDSDQENIIQEEISSEI